MDPRTLARELVTVTLTYGKNKTFTFHGRMGNVQRLAVIPSASHVYTCTEAEAVREGYGDSVADWVAIWNEHGDVPAAPAGARGAWGSQNPSSDFRIATGDWICGTDWRVRLDSPSVKVEPLTEEGRKWIEDNLSTDKRRQRLVQKLMKLDPALINELDDVLYRTAQDARSETF